MYSKVISSRRFVKQACFQKRKDIIMYVDILRIILLSLIFTKDLRATKYEKLPCTIPFPNTYANYKYCCKWPHWFDEESVRSCAKDASHHHLQPFKCLSKCVFNSSDIINHEDGTIGMKDTVAWVNKVSGSIANDAERVVQQMITWQCAQSAARAEHFLHYEGCELYTNAFLNCYETQALYFCPPDMKTAEEPMCYSFWRQMFRCYLNPPEFAANARLKIV